MKLFVSVQNLHEARIAVSSGCPILDIKNPTEGSLGACFPWVVREIVNEFASSECKISAAIGDLPQTPGTAALVAYAMGSFPLDYIKAGLYGSHTWQEATDVLSAIRKALEMQGSRALLVAGAFADWRNFNGLSPSDLIRAASIAGAHVCLLDTFVKDGKRLFDHMHFRELEDFVGACRKASLTPALAGSLQIEDLDRLAELSPEFIGVRGAICSFTGDRGSTLSEERTRGFIHATAHARSARENESMGP
jgi:(5-formylfuran-3-yl)methyl phosphate synthase